MTTYILGIDHLLSKAEILINECFDEYHVTLSEFIDFTPEEPVKWLRKKIAKLFHGAIKLDFEDSAEYIKANLPDITQMITESFSIQHESANQVIDVIELILDLTIYREISIIKNLIGYNEWYMYRFRVVGDSLYIFDEGDYRIAMWKKLTANKPTAEVYDRADEALYFSTGS